MYIYIYIQISLVLGQLHESCHLFRRTFEVFNRKRVHLWGCGGWGWVSVDVRQRQYVNDPNVPILQA